VVSGIVSDYNVGLGSALSSTKNFGMFFKVAMESGFVSAVQFMSQMERNKSVVEQLTASEKSYVEALVKRFGLEQTLGALNPAQQAHAKAYAATLDTIPPKIDKARASAAAVVQTKQEWLAIQRQLNPLITVMEGRYQNIAAILKGMPKVDLSLTPPPISLPVTVGPLDFSQIGKQVELGTQPEFVSVGKRIGDGLKGGFTEAMSGLGNVIVGALQGGGDVAKSAGAFMGLSIGNSLADSLADTLSKSLGKTLGGMVGSFFGPVGSLVGGWIGGMFGGNDTKKDRESAAKLLGFSSLAGLNDALRTMGDEGNKLVHEGLNIIGKNDTAANQAWIKSVQDLFDTQKKKSAEAATAVENASKREEAAIAKVQAAIQSKIDTLDKEHNSVFESIREELENPEYDEAGNRIYGVIEAQGIARLEEIKKQKDALSIQMAEASATVMDEAKITGEGVRKLLTEIFKDPFKITFDIPAIPGVTTGGTVGGGSGSGSGVGGIGSHFGRSVPSGGSAAPVVINVISHLDGREVARNQAKYLPGELAMAGF
jgi:uncharacterized protein YqgV (UPF0045/DUF77 family)